MSEDVPSGGGPGAEGLYYVMTAALMTFVGAFFLPPLLLFAPAPLAALVYRRGYRTGMLAGLALALASFWMQGATLAGAPGLIPPDVLRVFQIGTLVGLLIVGLVGLTIGGSWREGASTSVTLLAGVAAFALPPVLVYGAALVFWEIDLVQEAFDVWRRLGEEVARQRQAAGEPIPGLDQMADWVAMAEASFAQLRPVLLAFLMSAAFAGTLGSMVLASRMLRRRTPYPEGLPPFQLWRFPWYVVLGFIAGQGLAVLETLGVSLGWWAVLGLNLRIFFSNVFLVQGLAVVYYFLTRRPAAPALRIAVITALAFWLAPVVVWLGVLDSWFNFRRLESREAGGD